MITKIFTAKRKFIVNVSLSLTVLLTLVFTGAQAQITVSIGSAGTGTSNYWPNYYLYGYSYSQQIVEATEINSGGWGGGAALISKIRFKPTMSAPTVLWQDWVVYFGNTSKASFSSTTDWIPVASMTQVFAGTIPANVTANVWMELTLPTPFLWDGISNLVIAVDENTPNWGNTPAWAGYTTTANKGIYYYNDTTNPDPLAPPVANGRNTSNMGLAQIQFEFTGATPCSGTPSPGNTEASAVSVCADSAVVLSLQNNPPVSGLTYQWQSSPDGITWTNFGTNYPIQNQTQMTNTWYQCIVTCTNSSQSDTSAPIQVLMNLFTSCYCASSANSAADEDIFNVTFGTLNNTSDCNTTASGVGSIKNRYSNYMSGAGAPTPPSVLRGTLVPFSIQINSCASYYFYMSKIFIDYNQNGLFSDPGEEVYVSPSYTSGPRTESGTILIPMSAVSGLTAMRVITQETAVASAIIPCGSYSLGETEDYMINIGPTVGFQNNFQSKVNILNAYPQPTSDMLNVEYTAEKGLTLITLSEISGRVLIRQTHANVTGKNSLQLDLSKVARGVYLLNVQTNGSNNQMSIVVE